MKALEEGIYSVPSGFEVKVQLGSGTTARKDRRRFPLTATLPAMRAWRQRALDRLARQGGRGTLGGDVEEYLQLAPITAKTKKRRTQQLAWWCAQPVAFGAEVLSVDQVRAEAEALTRDEPVPVRRTLGTIARHSIELKRVREILSVAFAPTDPDTDPTEFASTSNHYRTALLHLFTVLDQDVEDAVNPILKVNVRPQAGAQLAGQDMRIVAEVLKHAPSKFGKSSDVSQLRVGVLTWVHITATQLMGVDIARDFHDVPDATHDDIIGGAITLTKRPRFKGRLKRIPPPETIPLNPWGVAAMRAFAAEPKAHGPFSMSPLNKFVRRGARRAQAALAKQGVVLDLSELTLRHLKHSLATAAQIASAGLINRHGVIQQSKGVQRALDHAHAKTTLIYTQAAVDPVVRHANAATSRYLEHLFTIPLKAPTLRLVASGEGSKPAGD